jgi:hypothetical protein
MVLYFSTAAVDASRDEKEKGREWEREPEGKIDREKIDR